MVKKAQMMAKLRQVMDPELGISVVDLGLIYDVKIDKTGNVQVKMTLTTMGCPLFEMMAGPIKINIMKLPGVKKVEVELTFDPPWTVDKMSQKAKMMLGLI